VTTPRFDPAAAEPVTPGPSAAPTEPVPAFRPPSQPAFQAAFAPPEPEPVRATTVASSSGAAPKGASGGSSRILNLALGLAVVVAVGGVAFAVGRATAPATTGTAAIVGQSGTGTRGNGFPNGSFNPDGSPRPGGFTGRGGFGGLGGGLVIEGTVDSVAPDSVTIKTADGNTITVGLDSSTTYHSAVPATAADVTAGKTVKLQVTGGFRPGGNGGTGGNGNGGTGGNGNGGNGGGTGTSGAITLGTAGDITIVP